MAHPRQRRRRRRRRSAGLNAPLFRNLAQQRQQLRARFGPQRKGSGVFTSIASALAPLAVKGITQLVRKIKKKKRRKRRRRRGR